MSIFTKMPYPIFCAITAVLAVTAISYLILKRKSILKKDNGKAVYAVMWLTIVGLFVAMSYRTIREFAPYLVINKLAFTIIIWSILSVITVISFIHIYRNPETRPIAIGLGTILGICILVLLYCFRYNIADLFQSIF